MDQGGRGNGTPTPSQPAWTSLANGYRDGCNVYQFGYTALTVAPGSRLDRLCRELKMEFSKLRMQRKANHWYWRLLGWLVLIVTFGSNRTFVERYTTTLPGVVAWSEHKWKLIAEGRDLDRVWTTLMHEREHLRQFRWKGPVNMGVAYLLIWFPVGLAWYRAKYERDGYLQTLRCWYLISPRWARSPEARQWWIERFTSGAYGWMWPFKSQVGRWYDDMLEQLEKLAA